VTNIPYASYAAYVYASQDAISAVTLSISNGATTYYYASSGSSNAGVTSLLRTVSTNQSSPTLGPAQYQVFAGLSGPTLTLTTGGSISGIISNNFFGLQIVQAAAPVPVLSPWVLAGLGALLAASAVLVLHRTRHA
jgi:hypothetical protein